MAKKISILASIRSLASHVVIERTTETVDGIVWNCTKNADGTCEAICETAATMGYGTSWVGGYFHQAETGVTAPSWIGNMKVVSITPVGSKLSNVCGALVSGNNIKVYLHNGVAEYISGSDAQTCSYHVVGTWQI